MTNKVGALLFLIAHLVGAQSSPLTNQDVLKMTKAGLSPAIIVDKIATEPCRFDTSTDALTSLKSGGVDDSVVSAMIRCHPAASPHEQPHVWVGANEEWVAYGNSQSAAYANGSTAAETTSAKATVQNHSEYPDVTRALTEKCQGLVITDNTADADYAVGIQRYHAGHLMTQKNEFSIFRARDSSLVFSGKTTWLKNAAGDICSAILHDAGKKSN